MRATNTTLEFYADPISPYVYIAWHRLRTLLTDRPEITVQVRPVLLAGLLGHFGQLGPAEIAPKRVFTFKDRSPVQSATPGGPHQALRGPARRPAATAEILDDERG